MSKNTRLLSCTVCRRTFRDKYNLDRHVTRKKPCQPIVDLNVSADDTCRFCGRAFSRLDALKRHKKNNCRILKSEEGFDLLYDHVLQKAQQLEVKEKELTELQEKQIFTRTPVPLPGGGNVNVLINVQINVFGNETSDHISRDIIKDILTESNGYSSENSSLKPKALEAILQTAMIMYSNIDKPENITCYVPSQRSDNALVHGVKGWELQPISLVIAPMTTGSINIIFDKQPVDSTLVPIMDYIRSHEKDIGVELCKNNGLKGLLYRNKDLLKTLFGALPSTKDAP